MPATDDIKSRLDIVSYIERHLSLKKTGKYYKACCPFHNEKTPSFVVNPDTQSWRCFGACAEGGDIFTFYEKLFNVDFKGALKALAEEAGVELPDYGKKKKLTEKQERHLQILDELATSYTKLLTEFDGAQSVRDYLAQRGISTDSIQQWRLGYAPKQNIVKKLLAKYQLADLKALGIVYLTDHGQIRCRFWNRLMIPIMNGAGQIVGFGARKLDTGKSAKYINSHESKIFHKSHLLYGWHTARKPAQFDSQIIVVEGYMDVIQAHQAGYINVVAQMGTAMTEEQIKLITDTNIKTITLCLDGDSAGQQATQRAIDNLIPHASQKDIRIAQLPTGQDPDDIIQQGAWEQTIEGAIPVIDYLITTATAQLPDNPSLGQRHNIANQLIPKLYALEESSKLWSIQQLATALGLNPMALADMAHKLMTAKEQSVATPELETMPHNPIEAYVVRCLLENPGWYYDIIAKFEAHDLSILSRTDFTTHGELFQRIIDTLDTLDHAPDVIDINPASLSPDEPDRTDCLMNAFHIRLKLIQRTMDELLEMQNIEQFSATLTQRTHLTQVIAQIS